MSKYFSVYNLKENPPSEKENKKDGRALALGMMDGVHLGHKELIKKAAIYAGDNNLTLCAMTFLEPPIKWTDPSKKIELITSLKERFLLFKSLGVEEALVFNFEEVSTLEPEEYLEDVIKKELNVKYLSCGQNHRFGQKQKGNNQFLQQWTKSSGIHLEIVSTVQTEKQITVSSSLVRNSLKTGDLKEASKLLGHDFFIYQPLVTGKKIGTQLGFPTLNFEYNISSSKVSSGQAKEDLLIKDSEELTTELLNCRVQLPFGVYAAKVEIQGQKMLAAVNLGIAPTVYHPSINRPQANPLLEAHLLSIDDLQLPSVGEFVKVELLEFLRPEKKFSDLSSLKEQIQKDCDKIRASYLH